MEPVWRDPRLAFLPQDAASRLLAAVLELLQSLQVLVVVLMPFSFVVWAYGCVPSPRRFALWCDSTLRQMTAAIYDMDTTLTVVPFGPRKKMGVPSLKREGGCMAN